MGTTRGPMHPWRKLVHKLPLLLLAIILFTGAVAAESLSISFMPAIYIEDISAAHPVNNLTIESDQDVANGSWILLGTNDQITFHSIDSRRYIPFAAGIMQQFNCSNADSYRWWYLYLTDGFNVGSTLTVHFNYSAVPQEPKEQFITPFNLTMKRPPVVAVFDFSKNPTGFIANYTMVTNQTAIGVEWYMYGTNVTPTLGDSTATPTLIDYQSSVTFTNGVKQSFDISTADPFQFYILYLRSGLATPGTRLEVAFNSGVAPPVVTPTPGPTPVANVTAVQPLQYTDKNYFYFFGTGAFVMMIGALIVRKNEEIFAGVASVFALVSAVISSTTNFSRSFVYFDPATVTSSGVQITNGTTVVSHIYVVLPNAEVTVVFGILMAIAVVSTIRFYLNKAGGEE